MPQGPATNRTRTDALTAAATGAKRRSERGSAIALLGFIGLFIILAALLIGGVTRRVVDRSRAQAAADAAALAGVADGQSAAAAIASLNSATLVRFEDHELQVTVEVRTPGGTIAQATAERGLDAFDGG